VLHLLAGHGDIDVTARSSSFAFRDEKIGASDIGRRLNVRYLLQGSVQREAELLRVTATAGRGIERRARLVSTLRKTHR
jgi:TolB-like protein